jgi:hypothetical protein
MAASYFGKKAPYGFVMELHFCMSLFCGLVAKSCKMKKI